VFVVATLKYSIALRSYRS